MVLLFVTSEIGHRLHNAFDEIDDAICQLEWYQYPIEIQRILPLIMTYTQKPVVINFFGSFSCSREQFKRVRSSTDSNHFIRNKIEHGILNC